MSEQTGGTVEPHYGYLSHNPDPPTNIPAVEIALERLLQDFDIDPNVLRSRLADCWSNGYNVGFAAGEQSGRS